MNKTLILGTLTAVGLCGAIACSDNNNNTSTDGGTPNADSGAPGGNTDAGTPSSNDGGTPGTDGGTGGTQTAFWANLTAAQETPAPTSSVAVGIAIIKLNADKTLTYNVSTNAVGVTAAHIHLAPAGMSGGVQFALTPANGTKTNFQGTTAALTNDQLTALNAQNLYVNVHTTVDMGGATRGQIVPASAIFKASINGTSEVPPTTSTSTGAASFAITADKTAFAYIITDDVASPTAAHIHKGAAGASGGVAVGLFPQAGANAANLFGTATFASVSNATAADFASSGLYVNIHTAANPGGDIRGQIVPNN